MNTFQMHLLKSNVEQKIFIPVIMIKILILGQLDDKTNMLRYYAQFT